MRRTISSQPVLIRASWCGKPHPNRTMKLIFSLITLLCAGLGAGGFAAELAYPVVDTATEAMLRQCARHLPPAAGGSVLRPGRAGSGGRAGYTLERRRADGAGQRHRPDLAAQPGHRRRRRADRGDKLTLGAGPGAAREAQRRAVRRLRRLAAAVASRSSTRCSTAAAPTPAGRPARTRRGLTPFIDTKFFKFAYGDTSAGERVIDSQYASSTKYVGKSARGFDKLFGVNFADGRIKGYDLQMPGGAREDVLRASACAATRLRQERLPRQRRRHRHRPRHGPDVVARPTAAQGMNWQDALAWVQAKNAEKFLGHDDWRLPNVKELQSIVDYTRSPDTTPLGGHRSRSSAARTITNEAARRTIPFYWSCTTHAGLRGRRRGDVCRVRPRRGLDVGARHGRRRRPRRRRGGRTAAPAAGPGGPPGAASAGAEVGEYRFVDVHGAGAQRSDPKTGDPGDVPARPRPAGRCDPHLQLRPLVRMRCSGRFSRSLGSV